MVFHLQRWEEVGRSESMLRERLSSLRLVHVHMAKGTVWSLLLEASRMERTGRRRREAGKLSNLLSCTCTSSNHGQE